MKFSNPLCIVGTSSRTLRLRYTLHYLSMIPDTGMRKNPFSPPKRFLSPLDYIVTSFCMLLVIYGYQMPIMIEQMVKLCGGMVAVSYNLCTTCAYTQFLRSHNIDAFGVSP